jgi:hypothetical protein
MVDAKQIQYCGPILLGINFQVEVFFLCCVNLEAEGGIFDVV